MGELCPSRPCYCTHSRKNGFYLLVCNSGGRQITKSKKKLSYSFKHLYEIDQYEPCWTSAPPLTPFAVQLQLNAFSSNKLLHLLFFAAFSLMNETSCLCSAAVTCGMSQGLILFSCTTLECQAVPILSGSSQNF